MPSATKIKQIVQDLNERKSEIARKFDARSNDSTWRENNKAVIQAWDTSLDMPGDLAGALGLTEGEKAHINEWPELDKTKVRDAIVQAIEDSRPMEFFWDLNDDLDATESVSDIVDPGPPGTIKVTFFTPRSKVTKPGPTIGDIKVEV